MAECDPPPGYTPGPSGGKYYKFIQGKKLNFAQAVETCTQDKAWLAMTKSEEDFADVANLTANKKDVWVGLIVTKPSKEHGYRVIIISQECVVCKMTLQQSCPLHMSKLPTCLSRAPEKLLLLWACDGWTAATRAPRSCRRPR